MECFHWRQRTFTRYVWAGEARPSQPWCRRQEILSIMFYSPALMEHRPARVGMGGKNEAIHCALNNVTSTASPVRKERSIENTGIHLHNEMYGVWGVGWGEGVGCTYRGRGLLLHSVL